MIGVRRCPAGGGSEVRGAEVLDGDAEAALRLHADAGGGARGGGARGRVDGDAGAGERDGRRFGVAAGRGAVVGYGGGADGGYGAEGGCWRVKLGEGCLGGAWMRMGGDLPVTVAWPVQDAVRVTMPKVLISTSRPRGRSKEGLLVMVWYAGGPCCVAVTVTV